jgi:hypothetical protein
MDKYTATRIMRVYGKGYIHDLARAFCSDPKAMSESDVRELEQFWEGFLTGLEVAHSDKRHDDRIVGHAVARMFA